MVGLRQKGNYILMYHKWEKFVIEYKTLGHNKVQVLRMKGLPWGELGIINIYAPNNLLEKNNMWELMKMDITRQYK